LSPEAEDYIFWWLEISPQHQSNLGQTQTIALRADQKYFMDGREVESASVRRLLLSHGRNRSKTVRADRFVSGKRRKS
jgi:hypothetical protein